MLRGAAARHGVVLPEDMCMYVADASETSMTLAFEGATLHLVYSAGRRILAHAWEPQADGCGYIGIDGAYTNRAEGECDPATPAVVTFGDGPAMYPVHEYLADE